MSYIWSTSVPLLSAATKVSGIFLGLVAIRGLIWLLNLLVFAPRFDPLRNLRGPEGTFWESHFIQVSDPTASRFMHDKWINEFGKTWRINGYGKYDYRLMTLDFRAINHVLNSPTYEKPWETRRLLSNLIGKGVSTMEGRKHKIERKAIRPAFTLQRVKSMSGMFLQKAEELRDCLDKLISTTVDGCLSYPSLPSTPSHDTANQSEHHPLESAVVDVYDWASRATFDVMGLANFDHLFDCIHDETQEIYLAFRRMFRIAESRNLSKTLQQIWLPFIDTLLPDEDAKTVQTCVKVIQAATQRLLESKREAIIAEKSSTQVEGKDIISLLIKSNMSEDLTRTDSEIVDQLMTVLYAGWDTTSLSISWCIHQLSMNPSIQDRLRQELLAINLRNADANMIESLPLLDAVIRETLRFSSPVHATIRVAMEDDLIPLSEPTVLRDGSVSSYVKIRKGSFVHIPIDAFNTCKTLWGKNSSEFNPDRWLDGSVPSHPGLAGVMTFSFGSHSCLGYKFSILETKVFIATLISHFIFEPVEKINKLNSIVVRPFVDGKFDQGIRLPVKVTKYCP